MACFLNGPAIIGGACLLAGCAAPVNPSFPLTMADAKVVWSAMEDDPRALARPVVILGGIYDPGLAASHVAKKLHEIAGDDAPIVHVGFLDTESFDRCAAKVIDEVNERFASVNPARTIELDVIGFSMGGLVARYAASDAYAARSGRRLAIARLFTVSSPHQGAKLAWVPTFDRRIIDMRADSDFLHRLNAEPRGYELVAYARLHDQVVGEDNAAPPGETAWWLSKHFGLSHATAYSDMRILADIARRLRDEHPFTSEPAWPLPIDQASLN
jgi:hypothetical protein